MCAVEKISISTFWMTNNLSNGEKVVIRNLGEFYAGQEFKAIVRGIYGWDSSGNPDAYIVEMIDPLQHNPEWGWNDQDEYQASFTCRVFTRACVHSASDIDTVANSKMISVDSTS